MKEVPTLNRLKGPSLIMRCGQRLCEKYPEEKSPDQGSNISGMYMEVME